jgi:hypothetical protein
MLKIKKNLSLYGIHAFLLPVFFVLHNYLQYYGLVSSAVALRTLAETECFVLLFFLLLYALTRNANRSLQMITLGSVFYLFFGVIKDFFHTAPGLHFASKYSFLFPAIIIIIIADIILIYKKKEFSKSNLYQNILLIIFIITDSFVLFFSQDQFFIKRNILVDNNLININKLPPALEKPDVYYLLFDCYPETDFLRDTLQYNNTATDTALEGRGFHVIPHQRSNYNRTAFSMSATMNFEYLRNINSRTPITPKDYNQARLSVNYAAVPEIFEHYGYTVFNLSIFNLNGHPAIYQEKFLTLPQKQMLLYNTLLQRIKLDILWHLLEKESVSKFIHFFSKSVKEAEIAEEFKKRNFNNIIIDSLKKIASVTTTQPKFIYAHFYLPHPPFFYDKNGKENDPDIIMAEKSIINKPLFLSYLQYTNKVMFAEIDKILQSPGKKPVIIIQSDHGYGDFARGGDRLPYFKNYTAYFFPDKNYSMLKDTMTNINTFPVFFNKYFNTTIPMQKDSSYFLPYN